MFHGRICIISQMALREKVSVFEVFNAGKYRPEKLQIRIIFTDISRLLQ